MSSGAVHTHWACCSQLNLLSSLWRRTVEMSMIHSQWRNHEQPDYIYLRLDCLHWVWMNGGSLAHSNQSVDRKREKTSRRRTVFILIMSWQIIYIGVVVFQSSKTQNSSVLSPNHASPGATRATFTTKEQSAAMHVAKCFVASFHLFTTRFLGFFSEHNIPKVNKLGQSEQSENTA